VTLARKATTKAVPLLYAAFVLWSLYGAVAPVETYLFRMVHMGFIFALAFLVFPTSKDSCWGFWVDLLLAALGVLTIAYALSDLEQFVRRSTLPDPPDFYIGILAILLLVEISRRVVGGGFTLVLTAFLLYVYLGHVIPGPLAHKGYDLDRVVGHMFMTLEGIFGVPLSVSVSFVTLFVVYGTFMDVAGAGTFWLELSLATMGRGPASAGRGAVLTTALLGGPQGSGVATTMSVSPVMWPILKQAGYTPNMAAGLIYLCGGHRRRAVASPHGSRRLPDHAVPRGHLLAGRGDGHDPHPPLLRRDLLHRGDGGQEVRLHAA